MLWLCCVIIFCDCVHRSLLFNVLCVVTIVDYATNADRNRNKILHIHTYKKLNEKSSLPKVALLAQNSANRLFSAKSHYIVTGWDCCNVKFQTKLSRAENLIATLLTDVSAVVRSNLSRSAVVMELLPLLVDVIQPTLRPVIHQFLHLLCHNDTLHLS